MTIKDGLSSTGQNDQETLVKGLRHALKEADKRAERLERELGRTVEGWSTVCAT
jgi:hypothetical protein